MIMLLMGQQMIGKPVMSLRTGTAIALVVDVIINPHNLKIEGWFVDDHSSKQRLVMLSQDVRDIIEQGFVVNDYESLSDPSELVRLQSVLKIKFELPGKIVVTDQKRRVGKVDDFAFEKDAFFVEKLYVNQSLVKSFSGGSAIVDRNQIVEINNRKIVVKEAILPGKVSAVTTATEPAITPAQP